MTEAGTMRLTVLTLCLALAAAAAQAQNIAPVRQAMTAGATPHFVMQRCAGLMTILSQTPGQAPEAAAEAARLAQVWGTRLATLLVEEAEVEPEVAQRIAGREIAAVAGLYRSLYAQALIPTARAPAHPLVQDDQATCTALAAEPPAPATP